MNNKAFEAKIAEARKYEKALSEWYQRRFGVYVLPTYDYSGLDENKAPKLICLQDGLVIPDLLVCGLCRTSWVECKWKTKADLHHKTGDLTTGINARHYSHYQKVKSLSGCKVFLMFLHVKEGEMRGGELDPDELSKHPLPPIHHKYDGGKMGYSGMVFWDWNALYKWADLTEVIKTC